MNFRKNVLQLTAPYPLFLLLLSSPPFFRKKIIKKRSQLGKSGSALKLCSVTSNTLKCTHGTVGARAAERREYPILHLGYVTPCFYIKTGLPREYCVVASRSVNAKLLFAVERNIKTQQNCMLEMIPRNSKNVHKCSLCT